MEAQNPSTNNGSPKGRHGPKQREEILNAELGRLLIKRHPQWNEQNVHIDSTHTIAQRAALKIDVLIDHPGGQPVAIETKFDTAGANKSLRRQVEKRIGLQVGGTGDTIESAISVKWPKGLTAAGIEKAEFHYAVHQLDEHDEIIRWPKEDREWMPACVDDLADAVEVASLSRKRIFEGSEILSAGVRSATRRLRQDFAALSERIGEVLHQDPGEQTNRMAAAILINAFVFHRAIEGRVGIPQISSCADEFGFHQSLVRKAWRSVLEVNYWPIFSIALDILEAIPARISSYMLDTADAVANGLVKVGATTFHDLAARMFQALIADRKFLATFYTLPESACLLAELAISQLNIDWSNEQAVKSLKVGDFACGTGTLLSAVQQGMYRRLRRNGLDDRDFHKHFMENVLLGTDIMPSAAHLAASMLSSAHPNILYHDSLVHVLPYGIDEEVSKRHRIDPNRIYIGALDLRTSEMASINLFSQSGVGQEVEIQGKRMTASGTKSSSNTRTFPVGHQSFNLVIMNPPFTRPTNHEAGHEQVPVPSFAGFGKSVEEQAAMSQRLRSQSAEFGHGNAGLATNFMDLAHDKLKDGGVLALVLPFTYVAGESWDKARKALSKHYRDITVVSIAAATGDVREQAFSADTGMAECLILATRAGEAGKKDCEGSRIRFINFPNRPRTLIEAHQHARNNTDWSLSGTDADYGAAGVQDADLGLTMMALCGGNLILPRQASGRQIALTKMKQIANRGVVDRDINGKADRGAFDIVQTRSAWRADFPTLWSHDAARECQLLVAPDSEGRVRRGMRQKAVETWHKTASKLHHNLDFRLNSQPLALCVTPEKSMGGRAWPNIKPLKSEYELPLLIWGNSTLGLMIFWWCAARQQQGRSVLTISKIPDLPTIDCEALSDAQLTQFAQAFEAFKDKKFLPANEAYRDETRQALDAEVFKILGLPKSSLENLGLLRRKWCYEPSVHGGKRTKPPTA